MCGPRLSSAARCERYGGSGKIAFRADHTGITLGAAQSSWLSFSSASSDVVIPWADVERIILYPVTSLASLGRSGSRPTQYIGIQRRQGAPALSDDDPPAPDCPVPGVTAGATRAIRSWQLDVERLDDVTTLAAPGTPIIDTSTGHNLSRWSK